MLNRYELFNSVAERHEFVRDFGFMGKEHKNVIRDIRELLSKGVVLQLNFRLSFYKQHQPNEGFKDLPCFR